MRNEQMKWGRDGLEPPNSSFLATQLLSSIRPHAHTQGHTRTHTPFPKDGLRGGHKDHCCK